MGTNKHIDEFVLTCLRFDVWEKDLEQMEHI